MFIHIIVKSKTEVPVAMLLVKKSPGSFHQGNRTSAASVLNRIEK